MSSATTEEFDQRVKSFFEHVDKSIPQYVAELGEAVAVPSVSSGKTLVCVMCDVCTYDLQISTN